MKCAYDVYRPGSAVEHYTIDLPDECLLRAAAVRAIVQGYLGGQLFHSEVWINGALCDMFTYDLAESTDQPINRLATAIYREGLDADPKLPAVRGIAVIFDGQVWPER